ncbi:hypothetical protein C8Q77DRAFT_1132897, partial [Trametes polyzona]
MHRKGELPDQRSGRCPSFSQVSSPVSRVDEGSKRPPPLESFGIREPSTTSGTVNHLMTRAGCVQLAAKLALWLRIIIELSKNTTVHLAAAGGRKAINIASVSRLMTSTTRVQKRMAPTVDGRRLRGTAPQPDPRQGSVCTLVPAGRRHSTMLLFPLPIDGQTDGVSPRRDLASADYAKPSSRSAVRSDVRRIVETAMQHLQRL